MWISGVSLYSINTSTPRVTVAGATLVDTVNTVIVFETALEPRLYVDPSVVRTDLLRRTETRTYCNYKGYATYWAAVVGDTVVDDVAWSHADPPPECLPIKGYLSFDAGPGRGARRVASIRTGGLRPRGVTPVTAGGCDLVPYGSVTVGCGWLRLRTFSLVGHTSLSLLCGGNRGGPLHLQCP